MRAFDIALIIALFTGISGVIADIGLTDHYEQPMTNQSAYSPSDFNHINGEILIEDETGYGSDSKIASTSLLSAVSKLDDYLLIKSVIMKTFASTIDPLSKEHADINSIANVIQVGCGFIYMFAIVQLWRKVSIKHME